jgi:hypothetical protein
MFEKWAWEIEDYERKQDTNNISYKRGTFWPGSNCTGLGAISEIPPKGKKY